MKHIKSLLVAALVALSMISIASASADPLAMVINDGSFDYTNTDLEEAYVTLGYSNNQLVVTLDDDEVASALPAIAVTVPELDKEDFWGNDINAELSDISEIALSSYGTYTNGFGVTHPDANVDQVVSDYVSILTNLGFATVTEDKHYANTDICVLSNGQQEIRMVATQNGSDVKVYLASL